MLKKLFLVILGIVMGISAVAQVTVNRNNYAGSQQVEDASSKSLASTFRMKSGFKVGANLTTMSNDMLFDPGFGIGAGFRVGAFLNLRWGQRTENSWRGTGFIGFQPELMFTNQSVQTEAGNLATNSISVPLMFKFYPTIGFNMEIGPEFSYLISTSPSTIALDGAQVNVGSCHGLNAGIAAGIGYDFQGGLAFGARYTYCLTDMARNLLWKYSNIQITVGWMF